MKILATSLLIFCTSLLGASDNLDKPNISSSDFESDFCRVSCTIIVHTEGGNVGITATAGNIFTSCEKAGEKACVKAGKRAWDLLNQR